MIIQAAQLSERTIWRGIPEGVKPGGGKDWRANRVSVPPDFLIREAVEDALEDDADIIYIDDHHRLDEYQQAELVLKARSFAPHVSVVIYNFPYWQVTGARDLYREFNHEHRTPTWGDYRNDPRYGVVDALCPACYLKPGVEEHTSLDARTAVGWTITDALSKWRGDRKPIIPFVGLLDPEHNNRRVAGHVANILLEREREGLIDGVVVWGDGQEPLERALGGFTDE